MHPHISNALPSELAKYENDRDKVNWPVDAAAQPMIDLHKVNEPVQLILGDDHGW